MTYLHVLCQKSFKKKKNGSTVTSSHQCTLEKMSINIHHLKPEDNQKFSSCNCVNSARFPSCLATIQFMKPFQHNLFLLTTCIRIFGLPRITFCLSPKQISGLKLLLLWSTKLCLKVQALTSKACEVLFINIGFKTTSTLTALCYIYTLSFSHTHTVINIFLLVVHYLQK